jgi:hypothetical protein
MPSPEAMSFEPKQAPPPPRPIEKPQVVPPIKKPEVEKKHIKRDGK